MAKKDLINAFENILFVRSKQAHEEEEDEVYIS